MTEQLTKAQAELHQAATDVVRYIELHAVGMVATPFDADARCILGLEDALRAVRFQGAGSGAVADAASEPTDEAQRIANIAVELEA